MTKSLEEVLNLAPMNDEDSGTAIIDFGDNNGIVDEQADHSDKTDKIFNQALQHAKDIAELAFNIDHVAAPRMFDAAAKMYTIALNATNSKRDAELKVKRLLLDRERLDVEKRLLGDDDTVRGEGIVIRDDRNALIKAALEQRKLENKD